MTVVMSDAQLEAFGKAVAETWDPAMPVTDTRDMFRRCDISGERFEKIFEAEKGGKRHGRQQIE